MKKELHPLGEKLLVYNNNTDRVFRTFMEEVDWTRDFNRLDEAKKSVEAFIEFHNICNP
jgi:hypothetical protein